MEETSVSPVDDLLAGCTTEGTADDEPLQAQLLSDSSAVDGAQPVAAAWEQTGPPTEWAFCKGSLETPPYLSPLDRLLEESPPCSIESLLDEDEIIQEVRSGNERLVERLSAPEGMRVLIEQVTYGPSAELGEAASRTLRRRPWIVTELLTAGSDCLFDVFGQPCGSDLLDLTWSSMDSVPDPTRAAVLAGYFCSSVATLLARRGAEVAAYLRLRDPTQLLERFLLRLESRSFAELLALLICAESAENVVFPIEGLALRLIAQLAREELGADVLEHVVLVLEVLLARACIGVLYAGDELLRQFADPTLVATLVEQALVGCTAAGTTPHSSASASLLSIAVFHMYLLPYDNLLPVRSPEFRPAPPSPPQSAQMARPPPPPPPPAPPPPLPIPGEEQAAGESDASPVCEELSGAAEGDAHSQEPPCARIESAAAFVDALCPQLPRLCTALDRALERQSLHPGCPPRAGAVTLEVVTLLALLAKTARPAVFQAAFDAEALPRCLQVFFQFPWNGLLHNAVTSVFREFAAHGLQGLLPVRALQRRPDLLDRIVTEVKYDAQVRSSGGEVRQRAGYVGHLRLICLELMGLGHLCPEVAETLARVEGWNEILLPEIEAVQGLQAEPLGGAVPEEAVSSAGGSPLHTLSEFDCISAVHTAMASLNDEVDLNLEDLRDLDEELDAEQAVAMASAHAKRRARGGAVCPEPGPEIEEHPDAAALTEAALLPEAEEEPLEAVPNLPPLPPLRAEPEPEGGANPQDSG